MAVALFADRYEQIAPLGQGTFGFVWRARDHNQQMEVALKLFRQGSPTIAAYREASILTALAGDHVLQVFNADVADDIPYVSTRVAAHGSVEDVLATQAQNGLSPDTVVSWTRHLLVGLGSCHEVGLLHRDIKPANLFLARPDWALLGDFGLAHQLDSAGRAPMAGTPVTIAPEMWDKQVGTRVSDIYSVGVTMYRLLTGMWPYDGPNRQVVATLALDATYPRIRDAAPHVSRRLADRLEKAMARDPHDRYQTWREMHDELARPGVVTRVWGRVPPHPGHYGCWEERAKKQTPLRVCVWLDSNGRYVFETRRMSARAARIMAHCGTARNQSELRVRLRRLFDHM